MSTVFEKEESAGRASPSCQKVRDWLINYIAERKLGPGDRVPSERSLSKLLGTNRHTIARAILDLAAQGILTREQGNGTFVAGCGRGRRPVDTPLIAMIMPYIRQDASGGLIGHMTTSRLFEPFTRENVSAHISKGVSLALREYGCRTVVYHTDSAEEEEEILANLPLENLAGAVVMPDVRPEIVARYADLAQTGLPIVFVDRYLPELPIDWVATDNFAGARDCVRYFISRGHHRIACFTDFSEVTSVMEREAGYKAALEESGIPYDDEIVCGPTIARYGRFGFTHALKYCLTLSEPVTAVFGMHDDAVWATLQAANKLGISVPDRLEVAGFFDDSIPRGIDASFTRVVQNKLKIGETAARLLLDRVRGAGPAEPQQILVPPELIPAEEHLVQEIVRERG